MRVASYGDFDRSAGRNAAPAEATAPGSELGAALRPVAARGAVFAVDNRAAGALTRAALCVLCGCAVFAPGCGHKSDRLTVEGSVTVDGAPLSDATISFMPVGGRGPTGGGPIVDGHYTAESPPGEKIVVIQAYKKVGMSPPDEANPAGPVPIKEPYLPARFNSASELKAKVDASNLHFDFSVESK